MLDSGIPNRAAALLPPIDSPSLTASTLNSLVYCLLGTDSFLLIVTPVHQKFTSNLMYAKPWQDHTTPTATWSGITSPTGTDWIGLYSPGAPNNAYQAWRYTTGAASGDVPFTIPGTLNTGNYELRLFANNGYTLLATSGTLTVTAQVVTLTLGASSVDAGGSLTTTWGGIAVPTGNDWIGLYTPGSADTAYLSWRYTTGAASGNVSFTVPAWANTGIYELRIFNGSYHYMSTSDPFTVNATIGGTVTAGGSPLSGVTLTPTSGGTCGNSNGSGVYSCTVPYGWTGSVTASLSGYSFSPTGRSYTNVMANRSLQDYAATVVYAVSGTITVGGSPLSGVSLSATNGATCGNTNGSGQYSCTVASGWSGTVTPALTGYSFSPTSKSYSNVTANDTGEDYAATVVSYLVSGTITTGGVGLPGVSVAASNGGSCTSSNSAGEYGCTVSPGWSGTITPTANGYSFSPSPRSYSSQGANQSGQDYTATLSSASVLYFIHTDHLNTPRLIADQSQTTIWKWEQAEPFGSSAPNEDPDANSTNFEFNLRFPGQYFDKETNLAYNMARDYDPAISRYIEPEPLGLAGDINLYRYARNNPLIYIDPNGENPVAGATIGGVIGGPPGAVIGGVVGLGLGIVIANSMSSQSGSSASSSSASCPPDDKPDCRKASKWDLAQAGIFDEHKYKREHGAIPESRFDICKCKDGSIRIARVGQCGKTSNFWD